MPQVILTPSTPTQTVLSFNVTNLAPDGTLDVQYAIRPDFQLCVAPLVRGVARANFQLRGLNPGTNYYVRSRSVRASGAVEDWSDVVSNRTVAGPARNTSPDAVMIEPAILVVPAPVLSWQQISGNFVEGYPVDNLGYDGPVAWVSKSSGINHIFAAEVGNEPVDTIALLASNAPTNATVTLNAGPDVTGAAFTHGPVPFRASENLPGRPGYHALIRLPSVQQHRFWRVEITAADVYERQLQVEHAVFGQNRSTKNHSIDKSETLVDLGTFDRTRGGNPIRNLGARLRRVDFDISMLTEEQFELNYADIDWRVGSSEPVLCVPNSKDNAFLHDRILYGPIRGGKNVNPASPRYTRGFSIESVI